MFERTERLGLIPFRRLLLIENVIDLGDLTVQDAMRKRSGVRVLWLDVPWEENLRLISETHYSRLDRRVLPWLSERSDPSRLAEIEYEKAWNKTREDRILKYRNYLQETAKKVVKLPVDPNIAGRAAETATKEATDWLIAYERAVLEGRR